MNGECTLHFAKGSIEDINKQLNNIQVRPSCEAQGTSVTYLYTIEGAVLRDTNQVMKVGIKGLPNSYRSVTAKESF